MSRVSLAALVPKIGAKIQENNASRGERPEYEGDAADRWDEVDSAMDELIDAWDTFQDAWNEAIELRPSLGRANITV
jgi:hypothetical protein